LIALVLPVLVLLAVTRRSSARVSPLDAAALRVQASRARAAGNAAQAARYTAQAHAADAIHAADLSLNT
jgi:hypothetical protein